MRRLPATSAVVLAVFAWGSTEAPAQARGPSAAEMRKASEQTQSLLEIRKQEWERNWGQEAKDRERAQMRRDPELSARRLAEMDAYLRRLTGRFRIEGRIERKVLLSIDTHLEGIHRWIAGGRVEVNADVNGVADCSEIGEGAGVNCLITASWRVFDRMDRPPFCPPFSTALLCMIFDPPFTAAERLAAFRPAVLVLGLNTDPPQLRGMLVTADTLTNEWAGKLDANHARLLQTQVCTTLRCYPEVWIDAEPGGDVVTLTFFQRLFWGVKITMRLHRDPDAQLEKALRPMKAR